jgi:hypothetical protein
MPYLLSGEYDPKNPLAEPQVTPKANRWFSSMGTHRNDPLFMLNTNAKAGDLGIGQQISRGFMRTPRSEKGEHYTFYFMYNPNEINMAYDFNPGVLPQNEQEETGGFVPALVAGSSISFLLFLDRTIEMGTKASGGDRNMGSPSKRGVLHDLDVYEALVGRPEKGGGPIISGPILVQFTNQTFHGDVRSGLNVTGHITSSSINMTHFNSKMIPLRCTIAIEMRRIYLNPAGTTVPVPYAPTEAGAAAADKAATADAQVRKWFE